MSGFKLSAAGDGGSVNGRDQEDKRESGLEEHIWQSGEID